MKILIVVEPTATGYSAYSPDLPGCVATGRTRGEVETTMRNAAALHLDAIESEGQEVSEPRSYATYVEVTGGR